MNKDSKLIFEAYWNGCRPLDDKPEPRRNPLFKPEVKVDVEGIKGTFTKGDIVKSPEYGIEQGEIQGSKPGNENPASGGDGPIYIVKDLITNKIHEIWPEFLEEANPPE